MHAHPNVKTFIIEDSYFYNAPFYMAEKWQLKDKIFVLSIDCFHDTVRQNKLSLSRYFTNKNIHRYYIVWYFKNHKLSYYNDYLPPASIFGISP